MALAAEEVLTARSLAVETAEAHRDAARRRQEAGLSSSLALSAAETEVARRQSEALAAVADLDAARRALGALLGGEAVRIVPTAPTEDGAARNAQVLAAEASVAAASRQVTSAWWRHAPTISGDVRLLASDVPYPTGLKTGWRLGLSLNWVLYDGGARYGLLRKQRAQLEQAEAEASQALVEAARAAADAREALDVAEERLALAEAAAWTAAEGRDASVRLFEAGVASSLDALDAQQRAVDAAVALASARAALGVAKVDLALALGWDQAR
jgi:outer membrane protein TolC